MKDSKCAWSGEDEMRQLVSYGLKSCIKVVEVILVCICSYILKTCIWNLNEVFLLILCACTHSRILCNKYIIKMSKNDTSLWVRTMFLLPLLHQLGHLHPSPLHLLRLLLLLHRLLRLPHLCSQVWGEARGPLQDTDPESAVFQNLCLENAPQH